MPQDNPFAKYTRPQGAQPSRVPNIFYPSNPDEDRRKDANEKRQDLNLVREQRQTDISARNSDRDAARTRLQNPQDLRREYEGLDEVKTYRIALQQANRAMNTDANPQGDLALTYAFAKAMDPTSAVREGEQASVANSQPMFQALVERVKKQFGMDGAGSYTPQARAALRQQIFRQVSSLKPLYDRARADMTDNALVVGVNPKEVIGRDDTATYAPLFRSYGEKEGDPQGVISGLIGGDPIKFTPKVPDVPGAPPPTAAGYGATQTAGKIPPEMQAEYSAYLRQNWGNLTPDGLADFRSKLDQKYGLNPDPAAYRRDAERLNSYAANGVRPEQVETILPPAQDLSAFGQLRNNLVSNPAGAAVAAGLNAAGFGIPGLLAPEQMAASRAAHPWASTGGDIVGGVVGAGLAGRGIRMGAEALSNPSVASLLAKPIVGDAVYGGLYGANTAAAEGGDPVTGALLGVGGGVVGNKIGGAISRAFPKAVGLGREIRALDETVPSSQALKDRASQLYADAESGGLTASGDETFALADRTSQILSQEGRLSPTGRLTDVQPKVKEAYSLIQDYAGQPMTPKQVQTVRGVISDGLSSSESSERRIARLLLDDFDQWTDATNPDLAAGLRDARGVASRYLQGDKIAQARDLADVRAGQFSNSGQGNALRTDFRQLDRGIAKGTEQFSPAVESAVADVARGTPVSNALRFVGRFAPTGPLSAVPTIAAMGSGGAAAGPLGAIGGGALGGLAYGARQLGQGLTERAAQVAENSAYGGPEYSDALNDILARAVLRGGNAGAGIGSTTAANPTLDSAIAQALLGVQGNTLAQ